MTQNSKADVSFIKALAEILCSSNLNEVEVNKECGEGEKLKVRLSRTVLTDSSKQWTARIPETAHASAPVSVADEKSITSAGLDLSSAVTSPMVGTVYLAPEPGAQPFVSLGEQINEGDTLLIIEAMKTMNQIPAPRSGEIKQILVTDGEPVEYDAPLMIIA